MSLLWILELVYVVYSVFFAIAFLATAIVAFVIGLGMQDLCSRAVSTWLVGYALVTFFVFVLSFIRPTKTFSPKDNGFTTWMTAAWTSWVIYGYSLISGEKQFATCKDARPDDFFLIVVVVFVLMVTAVKVLMALTIMSSCFREEAVAPAAPAAPDVVTTV